MTQIITFGSCLSRYTAINYTRLYRGKIISTVMHNRSDYFIRHFLKNECPEPNIDIFLKNLKTQDLKTHLDDKGENILNNQIRSSVGVHLNKNSLNIFKALERKPDIIMLDNYIDLSARMLRNVKTNEEIFFNPKLLEVPMENWQVKSLLSIEESVANFHMIIDWLKIQAPAAHIVFFNFPCNTYKDQPRRVERHLAFSDSFKRSDIAIVPILNVHRLFQSNVPQHFKDEQYCAYAGMVNSFSPYLSDKRAKKSIWQKRFKRLRRWISRS